MKTSTIIYGIVIVLLLTFAVSLRPQAVFTVVILADAMHGLQTEPLKHIEPEVVFQHVNRV